MKTASVVLVAVLLLGAAAPAGDARAEERPSTPDVPPLANPSQPIPEGFYRGTLSWPRGSYRYSAEGTNLVSQWSLTGGTVDLQVTGTSIVGSWAFDMAVVGGGNSSRGRTGRGDGLIQAEGVLEGDANAICMTGAMAVEGTITVEDPSGSIDIPVSETLPLSCADLEWAVSSSSCTGITGEWTVPLAETIQRSGASFPTNGTFVLVRVGQSISELTELTELDPILVEMDRLLSTEPLDGPALNQVLRRLAEFEGNNALAVACGQRNPANTRLVATYLHRLLVVRFDSGPPPDLSTLRWLAYAALNAGVIGSASPQPARAAAMEERFARELSRLIDDAVAARDADQLARIWSFAHQYGFEQVEAVADGEYERLRGGS